MLVMYRPLHVHSSACTPITSPIHLWALRAQNAGFIAEHSCQGSSLPEDVPAPSPGRRLRTSLPAIGELDVPAATQQVVGHRVGIGIGPALDERRLFVPQVVDTNRDFSLLAEGVDRKSRPRNS